MTSDTALMSRWIRSLWFNVVVLAVVLIAVLPIIGLRGSFVNDEGAALSQAAQLRTHGTWFLANQFPAADPDGLAFPIDRATHTEHGFAPLLKHPLYALTLAGADVVGGRFGMALVAIVGTLVASIAAGLIGREIRPGLEPWCVWGTGLASPLFFDSYIVIAHSLGAAAAGLGALGAVRFLRRGGVGNALLCALGLAWVTALRSEGALLGLAIGAVLFIIAFLNRKGSDRSSRSRALLIGIVGFGATIIAFAVDHVATGLVASTVLPSTERPLPVYGLVEGRVSAFTTTWLTPGYGSGWKLAGPFIIVAFATFATWRLRERAMGQRAWFITVAGTWTGGLFWVIFAHRVVVPGLLPAFPLLVVGLVAWRWPKPHDQVVVMLDGTVALFAALVLATEYAVGGGAEWGSRYVAIGIPLVVPLLVDAIARLYRALPGVNRPLAIGALVPLALAPALVSVTSLRTTHVQTATLVGQVVSHIDDTDPGDGGKPVIVTDLIPLPRLAWDHLDDARWLAASGSQLSVVLRRLHAHGTQQFLFVTADRNPALDEGYKIVRCHRIGATSSTYVACIAERT